MISEMELYRDYYKESLDKWSEGNGYLQTKVGDHFLGEELLILTKETGEFGDGSADKTLSFVYRRVSHNNDIYTCVYSSGSIRCRMLPSSVL